MGMFSRKTVISVASVIYPMGEDPDKIPDLVKSSVIAAGLRGTSVRNAINTAIFDGGGVKLAQAFNYARNHYYAGLPLGLPATRVDKSDPVLNLTCLEYLEQLFSENEVELLSAAVTYGDNYDTIVRQQIEADYNYDFNAGEVHTGVGDVDTGAELVYLLLDLDPDDHPGEIGYRLTFTNPDLSVEEFDEWYDEALFEDEDEVVRRVVMEYSLDAGPGLTISYAYGGSFNRLNILLRALDSPQSNTFPAIVLKKNNKYLDTNAFTGGDWETSEEYITSKNYGRRMGMNIDDVLASVKDNESEGDIDYCFIQPGTLINATSQPVVEYHFNYFNELRLTMPDNKPAFDAWVDAYAYPENTLVPYNKAENCPAQSIRIKDPDSAKQTVNFDIAWRYMTYEEIEGTLDDPFEVECGEQEFVSAHRQYGKVSIFPRYDTTKLYLRKRLSDTTYAELMVCGLWHENYVYKGHSVQSAVWEAFNDTEGDFGTGFLIPLDYSIFRMLSARKRLQLSSEAHHIVFNCYVAKKQKWYQTGFFKFFLFVVSIVLVVVSVGTAAPYVTAINTTINAALVAAGVSLAVAAAVAAIITGLIVVAVYAGVSFVAEEAGEWAAEKWGPEWGALVQISTAIALTAGITSGLSSLSGITIPPIGLTEQIINASSFILMGMSAYTQYQYADLQAEQKKWNDYITNPDNPLDEVNKMLEEMFPEMNLTQQAIFAPGESLDEFLGRTLTLTDGLINRLTLPISNMAELTLTPRLP